MPLNLIVGPPNSGRAGRILDRFRATLGLDPALVVPTADHAERFERELAAGSAQGAFLGGSVVTFGALFGEVARAYELGSPPSLSEAQRVWLARLAARNTPLRLLAGSASRPGFALALERLIDELQGALVDPAVLEERAEALEDGEYERELAALYARWTELREGSGRADRHRLGAAATAALSADREGEGWGRRPVCLYGFDDLTAEQLELVAALSAVTEVMVAVTYEDREALSARARLYEQLRELARARGRAAEDRLEADPQNTPSTTLFHLERHFLDPEAPRIEPGPELSFLEAAGERGEAELVGSQIALLAAGGIEPDEIAVVLRSPGRNASLWSRVLADLGIPATVEAPVPLSSTATGRGLAALLRVALLEGSAEDLVAFLRTPGRAGPGKVDRLEAKVRRERLRSGADAERAWRDAEGAERFEISKLREAGSGSALAERLAELARHLAEQPLKRRAEVSEGERALELRAAAAAERALLEIAEIESGQLGPAELLEALDAVSVPPERVAASGRVRMVSPFQVRAGRVRHLFVASLLEGDFPRRDPGSPLLSDERRRALGLPPRLPPEEQERYLFAVCLSRPTEGLHLSWRSVDDEGRTLARSPFVDEIRVLLAPPEPADQGDPDPVIRAEGRRRELGDVVLAPSESPSVRELARSLASLGASRWRPALDTLDLDPSSRELVERRLLAAEQANARQRLEPGPLRLEPVLAALGDTELFGASTLEEYATCPYRWFVGHELEPERLEPENEPMRLGGLAHRVLERLYREAPGGALRSTPDSLPRWRRRVAELVREHGSDHGLSPDDPHAVPGLRRVEGLVNAFLADEARSEFALLPRRELLEAKFGTEEGGTPPLDLGGLKLHGAIDRIDVDPGGTALVSDYKLSSQVPAGAKLSEEGKLQLQLYMLAARELWGLEPAGALYRPLAATGERRPRGLVLAEARESALAGLDLVGSDCWPEER
jgi:ATP-dependent helicase/DNAse subunit B